MGARVALAGDVPTALALARFQCADEKELPIEALADFACPFSDDPDALSGAAHAVQVLRKLGFTRLSEIAGLPPSSFASRFGREVAQAVALWHTRHSLAWPAFVPDEVIVEEITTEDTETLSAVFNASGVFPLLSIQLDRALARLHARGLRAAGLRVEFTLDDRSQVGWDIPLAFPQSSAQALMRIIQERIQAEISTRPLSAPLVSSRLTITETVRAGGGQKDFFDRKEEQQETLGALFEVLAAKLGRNAVFFAELRDSHLPEKSWGAVAAPKPEKGATDVALPPLRPSRLLGEPLRIHRERDELVCSRLQKRWRILGWQGPERLMEEWWSESASQKRAEPQGEQQRDYYQVLSRAGEKLWIFESSGSLYLHGYFD